MIDEFTGQYQSKFLNTFMAHLATEHKYCHIISGRKEGKNKFILTFSFNNFEMH
jgi:hypothetical protein